MIFESPEFGELRTLRMNGEPWFVGRDVAAALGYAKPENALSTHVDREDKTTTLIQGNGSNYKSKTTIINESGLYSLVLSSKLESARKFKRWVTSEVLPSIRRHGAYMTDSLLEALDAHPEAVPEYLNRLRSENARNRELNRRLRLALPKAEYYDAFVDPADCTNIRYTAKELGVPQKQFIGYLLEKGYVFRDRHRRDRVFVRAGKRNDPLFVTRDFYLPNGSKSEYTLVTPAGKAHFLKIAEKIRAWEPWKHVEGEDEYEQAVFAV